MLGGPLPENINSSFHLVKPNKIRRIELRPTIFGVVKQILKRRKFSPQIERKAEVHTPEKASQKILQYQPKLVSSLRN